MDELQRQVRRAQRRLAAQRLVGALGWCWFLCLLGALGLIVADKFHPLGFAAWTWAGGALGGAMVAGLVAALAWAIWTRQRPLAAAIELDRRFQLKERVSSTLAMPAEARASAAGRALIEDAARRVKRIDVAEKFAVTPSRRILLPLLPATAALLVALWVSPASLRNQAAANATTAAQQQQQVKKSAEVLRRKLEERTQQAEKEGLKDATAILKKLDEATKQLAVQPDREKAMVQIKDMTRQIADRRKQLGGAEKIKQQLAELKKIDRGPADKLADALKRGDFKKAAGELQKLQDQLAGKGLGDPAKQQLANQLKEMEKKLNQMAAAAKAAQADLQRQLNQAQRNGQAADAGELANQLAKLQQDGPQMQQMQQLAQQFAQCAQCLKKGGQGGQAAKAMARLQADLNGLQKQLNELETLDGAMEQMAQCRQGMTCPKCGGAGCKACQGQGFCQGQGNGQNLKPGGMGLGRGRGDGPRPEANDKTAMYDSQVRQQVGPGPGTVIGEAPGPNVKGEVEEELRQQCDTARHGSTDPLSGRHLPRKHSEQAQEYFDRFREGK
jgi:hypothetical protein